MELLWNIRLNNTIFERRVTRTSPPQINPTHNNHATVHRGYLIFHSQLTSLACTIWFPNTKHAGKREQFLWHFTLCTCICTYKLWKDKWTIPLRQSHDLYARASILTQRKIASAAVITFAWNSKHKHSKKIMVARESNAQMSLHLQMVRLFNLLGQGRQTVGSVSQLFIVHNSAKLKRTHTLFEKIRAWSSRFCGCPFVSELAHIAWDLGSRSCITLHFCTKAVEDIL